MSGCVSRSNNCFKDGVHILLFDLHRNLGTRCENLNSIKNGYFSVLKHVSLKYLCHDICHCESCHSDFEQISKSIKQSHLNLIENKIKSVYLLSYALTSSFLQAMACSSMKQCLNTSCVMDCWLAWLTRRCCTGVAGSCSSLACCWNFFDKTKLRISDNTSGKRERWEGGGGGDK